MTWEEAVARARRADKMRAFYEPAFFGVSTSSYMDPLGVTRETRNDPWPTTMGGFSLPVAKIEGAYKYAGPPPPPEVQKEIDANRRARRTRKAYLAPPVGITNLAGYGLGQLQNYGVGSLQNYGINALRRR